MKSIVMTLLAFLMALSCAASVSVAKDDWRKRDRYQDRYDDSYRHELRGVVESLPAGTIEGMWIVSGQEVVVTRQTAVDQEHGRIVVGSLVEVKGSRSDNVIYALRIERK